MIGFWNRREVFVGQSMEKFSQVRQILSSKGIKYTYKVLNRNTSGLTGGTRRRTGTFGQSNMAQYMYYVYVHRKDYEMAAELLRANSKKI